MSAQMPPPPPVRGPQPTPIWRRWWFWVAVVVAVAAVASVTQNETSGSDGDEASASCRTTAGSWLDTLHSAFYSEYRDSSSSSPGFVEVETSEGVAYYVAVEVDGVAGVAVFGTSEPPLQADPGIIAAANPAASQLTDLGADIPEDSSAGMLLLDDAGTSLAEACG